MRLADHHHGHGPRLRLPQRGFTLLELIVAMVIFAVLGTAILAGFQQAMKSTVIARDSSTAALLAKRILTELRLDATLAAGTRVGPPEAAFPDCAWQATITPEPGRDGLFDVDLAVHVTRAGNERVYRLQTCIFKIPQSGGSP